MTDQRTYHLLVIDSNPDQFSHAGESPVADWISADITVDDNAVAVKMADQSYDAILIDFNPASGRGLEYLRRICALRADTPVIALISRESESFAADVMEAGASGFIVKIPGYAATLPASLNDIINRYRSRKLEAAEELLRNLSMAVEQSPESIVITDAAGCIEFVNPKFTEVTGYTFAEAIGKNPRVLKSGKTPVHVYKELWDTILSGREWRGELLNKKKNGEFYWELASISAVKDDSGVITHFVAVKSDITELKRIEEELRDSERRLNRSQEIAHLGSWEFDVVNNVLTWSDESYRIFGLLPREFGANYEAFLEAVHPEDRAMVHTAYSKAVQEGVDAFEIVHRVVRKSTGEVRIVQEKCENHKDASGRVIRSVGMMHDITVMKQAEEEIRRLMASRSRLAAIVDSSEDAIIGKTLDGIITSWNSGAEQLYGYSAGEMIGKHVTFIAPEGRKNEMPSILTRIVKGEHIRHYETVRVTKDGRYLNISLTVSPIVDETGKIIGASSIARDITAQMEATHALHEKNRELQIINTITSTLNSSLDIDDKLQKVLQATLELVSADAGGIYLRNDDRSGELHLSTMLARSEDGRRVTYRQILQHVASGEKAREPEFGKLIATEVFGHDGFGVLVPMNMGDNLIGLIALYRKAEYSNVKNVHRQLTTIGSQTGIAVDNFMLLKKIQDSSRYLAGIVNESPDPIVTTSATGVIVSFNKSASRLLKFPAEEVIGKSVTSLLPPGRQIDLNDRKSYVLEFLCRDGTMITLSVSTSRLPGEGDLPGHVITLKDLSSISGLKVVPLTEKVSDTDRIYHFDKGFIYLFDRSKDTHYMDVFADQVKHNVQGLCVTRQNPKRIRQQYGLEKTPLVWLTGSDQSADEQCIKPENMTALNGTVNKFLAEAKDGVVLLDGAEYLITRNSFESFLKLIQVVNDHVMASNSVLFICLDPDAIGKQQYHQLITEVRLFSGSAGPQTDDE